MTTTNTNTKTTVTLAQIKAMRAAGTLNAAPNTAGQSWRERAIRKEDELKRQHQDLMALREQLKVQRLADGYAS